MRIRVRNPALLSSAVERTTFMKTALTTTLIKMGSYNSSAIYMNDLSVYFSFCYKTKEKLKLFSQFFFQKQCIHISTVFQP